VNRLIAAVIETSASVSAVNAYWSTMQRVVIESHVTVTGIESLVTLAVIKSSVTTSLEPF